MFDPNKKFWADYGEKRWYGATPSEPWLKMVRWYQVQATCIICQNDVTWKILRNAAWKKLRHAFFERFWPARLCVKPDREQDID